MIRTSTAGGVTTITLDRPEKLNAFSGTMREDLLAALRGAEGNVVVITGAGRAFGAGGDVESMASLQDKNDVDGFRKLLDAGRDIVVQIATMPKPVIALVNGVAAGARGNLALACVVRIASPAARRNTLGAQIDVESVHQLRAFQSAEARQRIMAFLKRS